MAVKIRLARAGAKKAPFYRIVAADSRSPRDGRFIEILGRYNPRTDPSFIELDVERTEAWIAKGAQLTETAQKIYEIAKNPEAAAPERDAKPSKKAQAKASAPAEAPQPAAVQESVDDEGTSTEEAPAEQVAEEPEAAADTESE